MPEGLHAPEEIVLTGYFNRREVTEGMRAEIAHYKVSNGTLVGDFRERVRSSPRNRANILLV